MTLVFNLVVFLLFWLMLFCNLAVAFLFGRSVEKAFAAFLFGISLLTLVVRRLEPGDATGLDLVQALDWAILVIAWFLALRSDRYWPIWFAAMQTLAVVTSAVAWAVEGVPHLFFTNLAAVWALPALFTMSWGTIRDRRAFGAAGRDAFGAASR
ncbi:hypothetical protein OLX02_08690 [Novosphingobium sp. KCTC 2891]|uniref:hypothetical protein n=1 Tax=Novosphingobium sp. KCTC 2891 TaxID=2989730 RepID=UPI002223AA2D|nr:hypothetical protein [Novosphingobium sp. KCTC 2891]MCW1382899.1 hypothetical protein [Novosphingobium sp. KCTC 2891]